MWDFWPGKPSLCDQKSDYKLLTEQNLVSTERSFPQHTCAKMEEIVNYTLYDILTSEQVITVKRTSPTAWANILRKFLKNNNKRALSEDDLKKKSTFISNFFRRTNTSYSWRMQNQLQWTNTTSKNSFNSALCVKKYKEIK